MRRILHQIKIETGLYGSNEYDQTILDHIRTVKTLCRDAGITCCNIEANPYFKSLCTIYSKTFIGFKQDGSVRELPAAFDKLLFQFKISAGGKQ